MILVEILEDWTIIRVIWWDEFDKNVFVWLWYHSSSVFFHFLQGLFVFWSFLTLDFIMFLLPQRVKTWWTSMIVWFDLCLFCFALLHWMLLNFNSLILHPSEIFLFQGGILSSMLLIYNLIEPETVNNLSCTNHLGLNLECKNREQQSRHLLITQRKPRSFGPTLAKFTWILFTSDSEHVRTVTYRQHRHKQKLRHCKSLMRICR